MSVQRASHLGICVSDAGRALAFYRDGLGFRRVSELALAGEPSATLLQLPGVDFRAIYLERDGVRIELLHFHAPQGPEGDAEPRPMNRPGLTHLSLRVSDLDDVLERLEAAGARVLGATRIEVPEAKTRAVFVTDPDGTLIELVEAPGDPAALPGTPR